MFFNLLAVYSIDKFEPIAKWLTIILASALILTVLVVFLVKRENFIKSAKICCFAFIVYALILGVVMLVLEILKKYNLEYLESKWVNEKVLTMVLFPLLSTVLAFLVSAVIIFVLTKKKSSIIKKATLICGLICIAFLLTSLVLTAVYYSTVIKGDGYYTDSEYGKLNSVALYLLAGIFAVCAIAIAILLARKDDKPFDTRAIALAGICVALSFALSYIKLFDMPFGGSITLVSWLPIALFSYIYGTKKGLLIGFLYGVLQSIQDPYIIHPAQFIIDYPLAFSMVGFAGALRFSKAFDKIPQLKFALSSLIAGSLRFFCHVLSGVFAFGAYAVDAGASSFWAYSLAYNSYVFVDIALVVVAGAILLSSKSFRNELNKTNDK